MATFASPPPKVASRVREDAKRTPSADASRSMISPKVTTRAPGVVVTFVEFSGRFVVDSARRRQVAKAQR